MAIFARIVQAENREGDFAILLQNNETHRVVEQYEMTHLDGDAPLEQSETKDGVDMVGVQALKRSLSTVSVYNVVKPKRLRPCETSCKFTLHSSGSD